MDEDLSKYLSRGREIGRAHRDEEARTRYVEFAKRTLPKNIDLSGLRVVIDCANGAGYKVAPMALWELGAEVFTIGVEPDGFNINDKVGSTAPDALRAKVKEVRADIGIALDGDADRVIIVDEHGEVVDGDQLMAVIAQSWHARGGLRGGGLVATVMSNLGLERYLTSLGLGLERTQVGDRYVLESMRAKGFNVGGEQSGHIILSDFTTTGDGLVAALQLLAVVKEADARVSDICRRFEKVPQKLTSVRYKSGKPLDHKLVVQVIAESRDRLGKDGRLVIRESGTEPVIRVMAESDDASLVDAVVEQIAATIKQVA
jgi:phosphoglucosamine mutase